MHVVLYLLVCRSRINNCPQGGWWGNNGFFARLIENIDPEKNSITREITGTFVSYVFVFHSWIWRTTAIVRMDVKWWGSLYRKILSISKFSFITLAIECIDIRNHVLIAPVYCESPVIIVLSEVIQLFLHHHPHNHKVGGWVDDGHGHPRHYKMPPEFRKSIVMYISGQFI